LKKGDIFENLQILSFYGNSSAHNNKYGGERYGEKINNHGWEYAADILPTPLTWWLVFTYHTIVSDGRKYDEWSANDRRLYFGQRVTWLNAV
jgi:hypothetical protein